MATAKKVKKTATKASKKPAAKAAPAVKAAAPAKKAVPVKKAAPVPVKAAANSVAAKAASANKAAAKPSKGVPEKKVGKAAAKTESVPFDVTARRSIVDAPVKKGRAAAQEKAARYTSNFDDDVNAEPPLEEEELSLDAEDELGEEEEGDVEGPPPWWKADPTGIENKDDEAETGANFDDSDEWTEDDEEWDSTPNASTPPAPRDRGGGGGAGGGAGSEEDSEDEDERW